MFVNDKLNFLRLIEGEGGDGGDSGQSQGSGDNSGDQGDDSSKQQEPPTDWQAKYEAQRKVNQDLEKKVKGEAGTLREENEKLKAQIEGREKEFQAEQERRKVEADALQKANERILQAEIRAAAAGKLNDPSDALRYLDLSSFEVGDDGAVDTEAVSKAIADLTETKPYLAAQGGKRFQGSADGGTRNEDGPAQLSRTDLAGMSPDEINKARAEGKLNTLLGRK